MREQTLAKMRKVDSTRGERVEGREREREKERKRERGAGERVRERKR